MRVLALLLLLLVSACNDVATPQFQVGDIVVLIAERPPYPGEVMYSRCPKAWTAQTARCYYDVRFGHFGIQEIREYELRRVSP